MGGSNFTTGPENVLLCPYILYNHFHLLSKRKSLAKSNLFTLEIVDQPRHVCFFQFNTGATRLIFPINTKSTVNFLFTCSNCRQVGLQSVSLYTLYLIWAKIKLTLPLQTTSGASKISKIILKHTSNKTDHVTLHKYSKCSISLNNRTIISSSWVGSSSWLFEFYLYLSFNIFTWQSPHCSDFYYSFIYYCSYKNEIQALIFQ